MLHLVWVSLLHISSIIGVLLALLLVSQVLRSPRTPAASMGWLFVIIFFPIIGIPLYLVFGVRKLNAQLNHKIKIALPFQNNAHYHPLHSLLVSLGIPSSSTENKVSFHADGKIAYEELVDILEGAKLSIDIAIFIFNDDMVGRSLLSILQHKAEHGVKVRLLLDGVGSFKLPRRVVQSLEKSGVNCAWFIPVIHRPLRGRTNLRNHRKIVVVDNERLWTGGRNFSARYLGPECPTDCWIDLSFSQTGSAVAIYVAIFEADWVFAAGSPMPRLTDSVATESYGNSRIQVVPSGPDVDGDPVYAAILTACYEARQRIFIVTPYYIPDAGIQEALRLAALRGVDVELILPARSNHRLADIARNRYLRELVGAGVQVRVIPDIMVHAKAFVFDTTIAMSGSANMDIRSLFLNCEVMSIFYSEKDIEWLLHWQQRLHERSNRYQPQTVGALRNVLEGLVLLGAYEL